MTYEEKIPDFALQPAKSEDPDSDKTQEDDGFDPTPYDRLLAPEPPERKKEEAVSEAAQASEPSGETKDTASGEPGETGGPQDGAFGKAGVSGEEPKEPETAVQEPVEPVVFKEEPKEEPEKKKAADPMRITPLSALAVYNELKISTVCQNEETKVVVEEDVLVPDVMPDLLSILSMNGKAYLSGREIQSGQGDSGNVRVTGELSIHTIYVPQKEEFKDPIAVIQSRLPFKADWSVSASPISHISIVPEIEKIEYTVINERKFHAKITVKLSMKEYAEKQLKLFDSLRNEKLELLKEKVNISHIAARKEDAIEITEDMRLKDGALRPSKILSADIRIVENHRQITEEKIVINANIWVDVLYTGEDVEEGEVYEKTAFFQGKTDFTQFILLDKEKDISASKVSFSDQDLEVKITEGTEDGFSISGNVRTSVELFRNVEKEVVSDLYHNTKDTTYDCSEEKVEAVLGTTRGETTAREIFDIPEKSGRADKILYINGMIKEKQSRFESGKVTVEGVLAGEILCLSEEDRKPFAVRKELPFRSSLELPQNSGEIKIESSVAIRELWFDKINDKQVEVNASLQTEATAIEEKTVKLIKNPCFVENDSSKRPSSMVIYIARKGDSLWDIAKRYKTGADAIRSINQMQENEDVKENMRLLIVK